MLFRLKYSLGSFFARRVSPWISENTFFVWEPCTYSHAEIVPGYVKYLLDLGFDVSLFIEPKRLDEGLLCRFTDPRITVNRMSQGTVLRYFKENGLSNAKGILITSARKIGQKDSYHSEHTLFANRSKEQKLLLVEHDVRRATDHGAVTPDTITLKRIRYKNAATLAVNPHYFGDVRITAKNTDTVRFITIGAMRPKKRNTTILIDAVAELHRQGVTNFKVTVIGRGSLGPIPAQLRQYFDVLGRVDFARMYAELEGADFFLSLLDPTNVAHDRYLTTGTSGSFQLIYGFAKPCLIAERFAEPNGFNSENSIVYTGNDHLTASMIDAMKMTPTEYQAKQQALQTMAQTLYAESLANLRRLAV
jgi:hypothetical protein